MVKRKVAIPVHLMYKVRDDGLFEHFSAFAQRMGFYTAKDYTDILEFLVRRWNVENLTSLLSGEGRKAPDFVCTLAPRIRRLEERSQARVRQGPAVPFSWIYDHKVHI